MGNGRYERGLVRIVIALQIINEVLSLDEVN